MNHCREEWNYFGASVQPCQNWKSAQSPALGAFANAKLNIWLAYSGVKIFQTTIFAFFWFNTGIFSIMNYNLWVKNIIKKECLVLSAFCGNDKLCEFPKIKPDDHVLMFLSLTWEWAKEHRVLRLKQKHLTFLYKGVHLLNIKISLFDYWLWSNAEFKCFIQFVIIFLCLKMFTSSFKLDFKSQIWLCIINKPFNFNLKEMFFFFFCTVV